MDDVFLNDKSKRLTYFNRNYFFVTTVFFVLLNIFLYMFAARGRVVYEQPDWYSFSIKNLFVAFANSFEHANLQHCMLNMLCFFITGIYLERKKGSLNFMLFVLFMSFFTAFASSTNAISIYLARIFGSKLRNLRIYNNRLYIRIALQKKTLSFQYYFGSGHTRAYLLCNVFLRRHEHGIVQAISLRSH